LIRAGLADLDRQVDRWNRRYRALEEGFRRVDGIDLPIRSPREHYVGSSIQFRVEVLETVEIPAFVKACGACGVELKWFGDAEPKAFTSRYDSWRYLDDLPDLPATLDVLSKTLDLRVPLTFSEEDCRLIVEIVGEVLSEIRG
jgi:dTDP-4-amino-4,6-dideoxygalactose transaminase